MLDKKNFLKNVIKKVSLYLAPLKYIKH